jgi:membrane protein implicated in regulation of membrane protease activity
MEIWHILITLAIIAFIAEIFTIGFISASIGIGFLFAAFGNYIGLETKWQILLFSLGLLLTYFLIRPIMLKISYRENDIRTNRDAMLGKTALVSEKISSNENTGRINLDGDNWKAQSKNGEEISEGTKVRVVAIESIVLIVEPLI